MNKKHVWNYPRGMLLLCDGTKLRNILYSRNLTFCAAAKEIGVGCSTFSRVYRQNKISSVVADLLKTKMDINPEDYNVHATIKSINWINNGKTPGKKHANKFVNMFNKI